MSTNEELAIKAKTDKSALLPLWKQVRRFAYQQAKRYPAETEDLMQAAFEALYSAIEHFDPARGSFLSVYQFYLKTAFRSAKSGSRRRDPIDTAISLDSPLTDDPDDGTLLALIEDTAAAGDFEHIEQRELSGAVQTALQSLLPREREVILIRYCALRTQAETAEALSISTSDVKWLEASALRKLRAPAISRILKSYF